MANVKRWLISWVTLTGIGAALIAVLVWFFGPLLAVLEPWPIRAALAGLIMLVWLACVLAVLWRKRRRDAALASGLLEAAPEPDAAGTETAAVRDKFGAAIAALKRARGQRGYLYEQPWYVIIGPPGTGKTTALVNSGLHFPLAAELGLVDGRGAIAGAGGTRHCDWWFAEQAVLIDTAGRYTTQDSDAAADRAGWQAFLDLLLRTRPRQPLNGIIIAISAGEILAGPAERARNAQAVRARINEISTKLGARLPIYALITKLDLVAGFVEFFDDLDAERREQVWGTTLPLQPASAETGRLGDIRAQLDALVSRLNDRLFVRLQAERSPERRALIAGFPVQVAGLGDPVVEFLESALGGSRYDAPSLFRGVYLSSGTQEGTPIDRLTGNLAKTFGLDQRRLPSLRPEHGRSYFLGRLLRDVVFGEALLVSEPPAKARRRRLLRAAAFAAVLLLTAGASTALWLQGRAARADTDAYAAALSRYEASAGALRADPVTDADFARLAPVLDQARQLPFADVSDTAWHALSQSGKLGAASRAVYRHALERALFPRLVWRVEAQMRSNATRPDFLYEATRVYLMLGGGGQYDPELLRQWMTLDWNNLYPGATRAPLRESLARHLDALLAEGLPGTTLDGALVASARNTFGKISFADRVYARIRPSAAARAIPAWTPAEALGATGSRYFVRANKTHTLTDGIPGFLTVAGFHRVLLPSLGPTIRDVLAESWVLGAQTPDKAAEADTGAIERAVVARYTTEYGAAWDAMLADLQIVPLQDLQQGVEELYVLGSAQSPLRDLLVSVARQLSLSVPPPPPPGQAAASGDKPAPPASRLPELMSANAEAAAPPGQAIDDKYRALRDFVGKGSGAPIDLTLNLVNDLQKQLSGLATAQATGATPAPATGTDPSQLLRAEAYRQPVPVSIWLQTLAVSAQRLRGGNAKQQAAAAFNAPNGPAALCKQAVEGRYPFRAGSARDIPLDDFGKLFAPGGMLDAFFTQHLRNYVDQSPTGWKLQPVGGLEPPTTEANVVQFQRAAAIRDLFFGAGGATPGVKFDITPTGADPGTRQVTLDLNGTAVTFAHGPTHAIPVTWPGPQGMSRVRLSFDPPPSSGPAVIEGSGPWALFRVLNQGKLSQQGGSEEYTLTFRLGDREATFQLRAGSVNNPFNPGLLQSFSCPQLL